jgi:hypothetical protein
MPHLDAADRQTRRPHVHDHVARMGVGADRDVHRRRAIAHPAVQRAHRRTILIGQCELLTPASGLAESGAEAKGAI